MDKKNDCGKTVEKEFYFTNDNSIRKIILVNSLSLGINLTNENITKFIEYLKLIQQYQRKINITSTRDPFDIICKHFLDSISCLKFIKYEDKNVSGKKKVIDVGSGAGFPGIPIKIMLPKIMITLLEARRNKKYFIEKAVNQLGLKDTYTIQDRAENLGTIEKNTILY